MMRTPEGAKDWNVADKKEKQNKTFKKSEISIWAL